ncbi:MAG: hypothetical protein WCK86_10635, partial [Planctomycetia bacterium]
QSTLNLQFQNFVQASGDFLIEKQEAAGLTTITASATNLDAFLGINFNQAGEFGVRIDDAGLAIVIEKATGLDAKFAVSSLGGTVSISGLPSLDLDGPLNISINKLGHAIDVDIPTLSGVTIPVEFPDASVVQRLAGDVSLSVAGFTTLTGSYVFDLDTTDSSTTKVRVAGTNISALLGSDADGVIGTADDVGAKITNGRIGAVFYKGASGTSYALTASGTAALVGVPGFTLTGDLAARVNTTGGAVSETITMPSGSAVSVVFAADETAPVFGGTVTAEASGFASISGGFSVSKSGSVLTVAASDVTAFVGSGSTGVRVTDSELGVVVKTDTKKYALVASGNVALEGVTGLTVTGTGSVRVNKLGEAISQTITTPTGSVDVNFADGTDVVRVQSSLNLQFASFVQASGDFLFEKQEAAGLTTITASATNLDAFLGINFNQAGEFGVRIDDAGLAIVIEKATGLDAKFAVSSLGGTVSISGLPSLDLDGPLNISINKLGHAIDVDIPTLSGTTIPIEFPTPDPIQRLAGDLSLSIAGFTTLTGTYVFELDTTDSSTTKVRVAGTNISALLGSNPDGVIGTADDVGAKISNVRLGAVFYKGASGTSYAMDASGTAALVGVPGITLTGSLAARVNTTGGAVNETITMPSGAPVQVVFGATESAAVFSGSVTADASGFASISGGFSISKSDSQLTVAAASVTAFVGAGSTGLRVSNGTLGLVVDTATKKYAAVASGSITVENLDTFEVTGSGAVRINTLGTAIDRTIPVPGGNVVLSFPTTADVMQVSGTVSLGISDFVDATATINVEKVTTGDITKLLVQSSNVTAFLGTGASTASTSDDMGVRISDAALDLRITINTATDTAYYAFGARGTASLVGISGLTLTGTLHAERNTGPQAVTLDFGTTSTADDLTLATGVTHFGGAAQLAVGGFVDISAAFDINAKTSTVGGVSTTRLTVAATDVQVFLGANGTGFQLTDGEIGAVIDKPEGGAAKYALVASGTASIVGVSGLTLTGTMAARVNQLGAPIDTTVTTPGGSVQVKFDSAADVMELGGSAELSILGFVSLSGSFGIKKEGDTLLVGVAGVEAFLGMGGGTSSAIGLQVSNGNLGLVLQDGGYALTASGDVGLVGLTGLNISGTFDIRSNQLGQAVSKTIVTPAGPVSVVFPTGESVMTFGGSAVISVAGIFEISGTVKAKKTDADLIFIDIPEITAALNINGLEVFEVGGRARFSIGGEDGFQLLDIGLKTVHVMGLDISAVAGMLPSLTSPPDVSVPPAAELTTIVEGVDAGLLNRRKYLDITLRSPGSLPLDVASVLDAGAEFTLSGAGVAEAVISTVEHLDGNRFRYYLVDSNPTNDIPLFTVGAIDVNFAAGAWSDESGTTNPATTDSFTVRDGKASTGSGVKLGPLSLQGPHFGLEDFQFKPLKNADGSLKGARITITVGLGVDHAALDFGGSSSVLSTSIDNLNGLFDVNVDISPSLSIIGGGLGKFRIDVGSMKLNVVDVLLAEANGVTIQYNPEQDTNNDGTVSSAEQAAYDAQEILSLQSASVTITKLDLKGSLGPYTRSNGTVIPGLVVRNNGFHLGTAEMQYGGDLSFGSILQLDDIRAGISDFGVNFSGGVQFDGEVFIASGGAALFPGMMFSMTFTDGPDANTEAVRAALTFDDGIPSGFKFNSDRMSMKFGEFLTIAGQDILINTEAKGSEYVVSIGSIEAEVKAGPLKVGGMMKKFGITGAGNFITQPGFGVELSMDDASPDSFMWPKWLPIRLTRLGIEWRDIQSAPADFALTISAKVSAIPGIPLTFEGGVTGLRLDVGLLQQGKFPITDLESIAVKVGGNFGGAEISGALIGGIVKLNAAGNMISSTDRTTPVSDRVLFIGLEGKLLIMNKGFQIRFAFSELGPLGVMISVKAPVVVEPVFTGITINEMTAGVEFFTALPSITEPEELAGKAFADATQLDSAQWLTQVKQQVVNQVRAVKANPNVPGFLAAFISPMTLTAQASISSTHLGSEDSFNAQVQLRLSTDGKMFAAGKFRFMNNRLVVDGRMYADLSQVTKGNAKVLFLGRAPVLEDAPNLKFLQLKGKFEIRFINGNGEPMTFGPAVAAEPTANLTSPGSGGVIGIQKLTSQGYIDVSFVKGQKELDVSTITDGEAELRLLLPNGTTVQITSTPTLVTTATDESVYRYTLPTTVTLVPGTYTVQFAADSFADSEGTGNKYEEETFEVAVAKPALAGPKDGAQIDVLSLNNSGFLTIRFVGLPGLTLNENSITDAAAEFVLSGAAASGITVNQTPEKVDAFTYKYSFTGQFSTGPVTVTFPAGVFMDSDGNLSVASTETFTAAGPQISLLAKSADIAVLNSQGYVDFYVEGSSAGSVDESTLTDASSEFTISGSAANNVVFSGAAVRQGATQIYRYFFSGEFATGQAIFQFTTGALADSSGRVNVGVIESLGVRGASATRTYPVNDVVGVSSLNTARYIEISFNPTSGRTLDVATILDVGAEIRLSGSAAADVVLSGQPTQIDSTTFRYAFTGDFTAGSLTITYIENGMQDSGGAGLTGRSETLVLGNLTAGLLSPEHQSNAGRNKLNANGYIDVELDDVFGAGLNAASLEDAGQEIQLYQMKDGKEEPVPGIGVNGIAEHVDGNTWRYRFSGRFEPGQVYVRFVAGSWEDNAGNQSVEKVETFNVYSNAASFEIIVKGAAELYAAIDTLKLVSVRGEAKLSLDIGAESPSARIQLDLNGRADVMYFGTVGAVSGRFIFEIIAGQTPGFWGVMKIDTNFEKLRPAGIDADLTSFLYFNLSDKTRVETLTLPGQAEGGGDLTETYTLSPFLFGLQGAGKIVFHVPDFNEDTTFGMELFRISGAFSMEISTDGLEVLAQGTLSIGPPDLQLFSLDVLGVLAIKDNGFASDLLITAHAGVSDLASIDGSFRLITNVSGSDQEVSIPQRFIDGGYFPQSFLDELQPTADTTDDPDQLAYVVHAGPPKWAGGYGEAGPYAVMQGEGQMYLLDVFAVEAAFRIEVSVSGLYIQAEGGLMLKDLGRADARGYLEITSAGLVTAMSLELDVPTLRTLGVDLDANAELQINTTNTERVIQPLTDHLLLEPITVPANTLDIKAEGLLAIRIPGTSTELARISGVFSLDTSTERVTIFAQGDLELGPRGLKVFDMEALGVLAFTNDGIAADLTVTASGGVPSLAELTGTFRMVANLTGVAQEVPVPQRFIDGGFLPADFVAKLSNSTVKPGQKAYVVPAGAPYLDGTPDDAASTYIVVMGAGSLTLVNAWEINGDFRIKVETEGPVIPIDATIDMGGIGTATVLGRVELRMDGIVAAMSVDLDTPGLAQAGIDFSADAELAVNTGDEQVEINSDTNPSTPAIVIPPKTSTLRAGGELTVRVPQTNVELISISGVFLMELNTQGMSILAEGTVPLMYPAATMISMEVGGAFFVRGDGVAAEIDMTFLPIGAAGIFSNVFDFEVTSTAVFNTTGEKLEIKVPSRFEDYLSDRAKGRLEPASDGNGKAYTVSGGAPLANGEFEDAGPYAVFLMNGDLTLASVFELTGNYRMVIADGYFEVGFGATMSLAPLGGAEASGMLNVSTEGVYGAVQLGGNFQLGGLQFFGAMQLEMNTTSAPVTIDRVQYDFDSRTISDTTERVDLPANSQRIFNTGSMVIPGFELEGTFELI